MSLSTLQTLTLRINGQSYSAPVADGGGKWQVYERSLYTVELRSVWGGNSGDIWFGGEDGYLLRYQSE